VFTAESRDFHDAPSAVIRGGKEGFEEFYLGKVVDGGGGKE
jgi:hypothetical protein